MFVSRATGLSTNEDTFGIFYPHDGLLDVGYESKKVAKQYLKRSRKDDTYEPEAYDGAFIVKISIEPVT